MRFLGVDVGTTAVKAAVFERDGAQVSHASVNVETKSPKPGWSEQSMSAIWQHVCQVIQESVKSAGSETIAAIGVSGQGDGLWALDVNQQPVRPAILWNDQRASDIVDQWMQDGTASVVANACRTAIWPGTSGAAFRWLQNNEPQSAERIAHLCHAKDWIGLQLTGELATDFSDATIPFLDLNKKQWSPTSLSHCDAVALERALPTPRPAAEQLGVLTTAAAKAIGLAAGIPVAVGTLDLAAMHIGASLNKPGNGLIILGTTAVLSTVTDPIPIPSGEVVGATVMHPDAKHWLNVQAPQSGSSALDWYAKTNQSAYPDGAADVVKVAASAPAGANGVIFQPYLTGERAPFVAPNASGALLGLTTRSTQADIARAVMEGVAMSLKHCAHTVGVTPTRFALTGGGARSALWRQIIADTLNAPLQSIGDDDLGLWGAALLGAGAADLADPYDTERESTTISAQHEPNEKDAALYEQRFETYHQSVKAIQPVWPALNVTAPT